MKIWAAEIGEPLPLESGVRMHRYGQLTPYLASAGHDVTWWTSSFSHAPKQHFVEADSSLLWKGVRVEYLRGKGYASNISLARFRHQAQFAKHYLERAQRKIRQGDRPDIILAPIPTIEAAVSAVTLGRNNDIPVLIDIRDLWPDELRDILPPSLRGLGRIALHSLYKKMEFVCKNATAIIGVSQSYLDYGLRFAERMQGPGDLVFPLGYSADTVSAEKLQAARVWRDSLHLDPRAFTVCFFGTIGKFFDLQTPIQVARSWQGTRPLQFVFAGSGSSLGHFQKLASDCKNVFFPGWINAAQIMAIMEISQAGIAPYKADAKMSLPNKPFEYMAGGLPVISSIQGELRNHLASSACGVTYQADDVSSLSQKIAELQMDESGRQAMGKRARLLLEEKFAMEKVFAQVEQHLLSIVGERR